MASAIDEHSTYVEAAEKIIVAVVDEWGVWPLVRPTLEARLPLRRVSLFSKERVERKVERLPLDYVLTTDARLRSRPPAKNSPHWFRHPYATLILVACEDFEEFRLVVKPRLQAIVKEEWREWLILYVSKSSPNDAAARMVTRVYKGIQDQFPKKRCCKLELYAQDASSWAEVEVRLAENVSATLDARMRHYDEEVRRLSEHRGSDKWNFCSFFVDKESLAFMMEMAQLREDALREYDELERCYLEIVREPRSKLKEFGGTDPGDARAALLEYGRKPFSSFAHEETLKYFDFRQYIFARQAGLLFALGRPAEVADRGHQFILSFSKEISRRERSLPFCLREIWVYTACVAVATSSSERFTARAAGSLSDKEFFRLQGDLYALARTKLMRLGDLVGYGRLIQHSPCNSAALSTAPWPRPAVWPSLPADSTSLLQTKEVLVQETEAEMKLFMEEGRQQELRLPLSPSFLLHEANRRRASLAAGLPGDLWPDSSNSPSIRSPSDARSLSLSGESGLGTSSPSLSPSLSQESVPDSTLQGTDRLPTPQDVRKSLTLRPPTPGRWGTPMTLAQVYASSHLAVQRFCSQEVLSKALRSLQDFEEKLVEVTCQCGESYSRAGWRRLALTFEAEVAALLEKTSGPENSLKAYERLCALYSAEKWEDLLLFLLPVLQRCQKSIGNIPGQLNSCLSLLAIDTEKVKPEVRDSVQKEFEDLAKLQENSISQDPLTLDVSALITFSGSSEGPLELGEGESGVLVVKLWSGFPKPLLLQWLGLTTPSFSTDEALKAQVLAKEGISVLPGENSFQFSVLAQRQGLYTLGTLTAGMGPLRLRSSSSTLHCGPRDRDDFLSPERPPKPVLKVSTARTLVEVNATVPFGLLMGELQWVGIRFRPLNYSLRGTLLVLTPGPGLLLLDPQTVELEIVKQDGIHMEEEEEGGETSKPKGSGGASRKNNKDNIKTLELRNGQLELPDFVDEAPLLLWVRVCGEKDKTPSHSPSSAAQLTPQSPVPPPSLSPVPLPALSRDVTGPRDGLTAVASAMEGLRMIFVKMHFGKDRSRVFERSLGIHFVEPLRASTRIVTCSGDGKQLLLQVTLASQVLSVLQIHRCQLQLQPGFQHADSGRSTNLLLPLSVASASEVALLFPLRVTKEAESERTDDGEKKDDGGIISIALFLDYSCDGLRLVGAHSPAREDGSELCKFEHRFTLQRPVLKRSLAVGLLPFPSKAPQVGQPLLLSWRLERLVAGTATPESNVKTSDDLQIEEVEYEVRINNEQWMLAGRKKGFVAIGCLQGSLAFVSLTCIPVSPGYVHPPALRLPRISRGLLSHTPAGPHLVCVLPPNRSTSACVSKHV